MRISLHRPHQIGGCITVIESGRTKIIIDFGSNLPGTKKKEFGQRQINSITKNTDAIFFTHYHGDHTGLIHKIPDSIPLYMGMGAKEVMECKFDTLKRAAAYHDGKESKQYTEQANSLAAVQRMLTFKEDERINVADKGEIFVTPYFVSHSAFDAYMFLIEAEGKRILHTGDFRGHGYLSKGLWGTLRKYVKQVDLLITEGTMLSRSSEKVPHEVEIKRKAIDFLTKGGQNSHYMVLCSSTDIDRLASFHKACTETGAKFMVDSYQKRVLDIFTKYAGAKSDLYDFTETLVRGCNYDTELLPYGFIIPVRANDKKFIQAFKHGYCKDVKLIYSMWKGYIEGSENQLNPELVYIVQKLFKGKYEYLHTSGHADMETLARVCRYTKPRIGVISIHHDPEVVFSDQIKTGFRVIDENTDLSTYGIEYRELNYD